MLCREQVGAHSPTHLCGRSCLLKGTFQGPWGTWPSTVPDSPGCVVPAHIPVMKLGLFRHRKRLTTITSSKIEQYIVMKGT